MGTAAVLLLAYGRRTSGGGAISILRELKALGTENIWGKKLFADAVFGNAALKYLLGKNLRCRRQIARRTVGTRECFSLITGTSVADLCFGRELGARVRLDGKPTAMVPRINMSGTGARSCTQLHRGTSY